VKTLLLFMAFGSGDAPDFSAFEDPKPVQTELRLIGDTIYEVPVGTEWHLTPRYKVLHRLSTSQPKPLTQPFGTQPDCPVGQP
jgi:hypothetical protein